LRISELRESLLRGVEPQRNYLRNPLPPGEGVCLACRSVAEGGYPRCYPCSQQHTATGGRLADAIVPISYSIKGAQHAHNLTVYKADRPSTQARYHVAALGALFLIDHWSCLTRAAGGPITRVATVPSTRGRAGPHPLDLILTRRLRLPAVPATANPKYSGDDRSFHADRFVVSPFPAEVRVLLLDDTWTTGTRMQSLAHGLKAAGAAAVVGVVLGRFIRPTYEPAKATRQPASSCAGVRSHPVRAGRPLANLPPTAACQMARSSARPWAHGAHYHSPTYVHL
jgi:hypothetical protein